MDSGAGRIVRRPIRPNTGLVREALGLLAESGADWSPRFVGVDAGDEVLTWLPGRTLEEWWRRPALLDELSSVVRELHDVTAELAAGHECLVHDDLQPRNIVVDEAGSVGLIDWEQLRPGRRIEDVAQLCWSFMEPTANDVGPVGRQWRRVVDVYGLTDRAEIVDVAIAKIERCIDDIDRQAQRGSDRHRRLLDRGDVEDLGLLRSWIEVNRTSLISALE